MQLFNLTAKQQVSERIRTVYDPTVQLNIHSMEEARPKTATERGELKPETA